MKIKPTENIPNDQSDANAWKQWHISLKDTFGRKTAAMIFVTAWNKRGNKEIITHDLNEYLEKQGIVLDKNVLGTLTEAGSDYFDTIGDFMKVGKYVVFAIVGIAVVGTAILVFQVVKNPIKSAQAAAQLTSQGRMARLAGRLK